MQEFSCVKDMQCLLMKKTTLVFLVKLNLI